MGKATIVGGGADGLYTIKIDAGAQQQASRVEAINQELTTVAERIAQAETEYLATTAAETNAMAILNVAIELYASAVQADPETASTADVDRLTGAYYEASAYAAQARVRLQALMLQQRQLESDKSNLAAAPAEETRKAWCVDLTEDASGDVATIEVPGEPGTVLVAPGGRAPSAGDGALLARELMTPEQAFFNAAILPGWQKWMPTFRTGTITAINDDNDTADVSLDAATSSAQGLGINQASSLSGVPVEYMECNAAAFEVGDPCVVRFDGQSWDAPRVVGFAREPKACGPEFIYVPIRQVTRFISQPVASGRYLHSVMEWMDLYDWLNTDLFYEGDDVFAGDEIQEATVKNSYVCIMSEATEPIDHADVDVFGASTYTAIATQRVSQGIDSYKIPLGLTGFFKTIKLLTTNYTKNLYIRTERNMMEYTGAQIWYRFVKPGTDGEVSYGELISGSVVNGMTHKPSSQNERFESDFPGGVITPDQFVGNVSSSKNEDAVLRTIFNAPNEIKRISPSGGKSTYHLHRYSTYNETFSAIYKRGKAPA